MQSPPEAVPTAQAAAQTPPSQRPDAQVVPEVHACPLPLRQAPLTACVPVGQTQVLVAASHVEPEGELHEHDVDPCGAVEPATHRVHGGPPPGP
jgi:hypothetical protein